MTEQSMRVREMIGRGTKTPEGSRALLSMEMGALWTALSPTDSPGPVLAFISLLVSLSRWGHHIASFSICLTFPWPGPSSLDPLCSLFSPLFSHSLNEGPLCARIAAKSSSAILQDWQCRRISTWVENTRLHGSCSHPWRFSFLSGSSPWSLLLLWALTYLPVSLLSH